MLDVIMHAYKPRTQEVEANGSLKVQGQPEIYSEFKPSLDYMKRPCLKKNEKQKIRKHKKKNAKKMYIYKLYILIGI